MFTREQPYTGASIRKVTASFFAGLGAMPTLVEGMLAVSLRSLGKHGTRTCRAPVLAPVTRAAQGGVHTRISGNKAKLGGLGLPASFRRQSSQKRPIHVRYAV